MDDIIQDIATVFEKHDTQQYFDTDSVMNFNKVKDYIILKVVGLDANEERLQKIPHTVQEDMAFTYHIIVAHDTEGAGTIQMESYPVTPEELHKLAMKNTAEQFPVKFQNMEEVIKEIMGMQMFGSDFMEQEDMQEMMDDIFHDMAGESEFPMYVLTNKEKLNGAATLFYPGVMEQIAEKLGGDFVVLPSSLHGVLSVPDNGEMDYQGLKDMVQEVNATQVAEDEVLTDQVYSYDAMDKVFERADKKADRLAAKDKRVE